MFYTVYQITNMINGKVYVGKHQTTNLNDSYMGSGKLLLKAIKKYGIENFKKEILFIFDSEVEMNLKEKEIVTEDFCNSENNYNLLPGGKGGFNYINKNKLYGFSDPEVARKGRVSANRKMEEKHGSEWFDKLMKSARAGRKESHRRKWNVDMEYTKRMRESTKAGIAAMNTEQVKLKKKEIYAKIGHSRGVKNSQYGTMWITNGVSNKKILPLDIIPEGWIKGRTINKK